MQQSENLDFRQFIDEGYAGPNPAELQFASIAIYRTLANGKPVSLDEVASAIGITKDAARELMAGLPECAYELNEKGEITAFIGLSLRPANHRLIIEGRTLYTWCAFDGIFIPELLGCAATIKTHCPQTQSAIFVEIGPDGSARASSERVVLSLVSPKQEACESDIRGAFCDHTNLFVNAEAFEAWRGPVETAFCVGLDEASELARLRNQKRFRDLSVEQRQLFAGLTAP